ncbi:MAG: DNA repair protein RecN [Lachnospiraceae bacterium]|nr:DNA repair protein RecN [Lachnoclostridium sp.]MDY2599457.1 DNA repair protein RecN [Lachnospiraceae bacterium]
MLTHLHVKNLAVVEDIEVDFSEGLNIITGETGAGKSVIIGSVNLALGGKINAGMIRDGAPYALVEIVFSVSEREAEALKQYDIYPEDGQVIISRKIMNGRSTNRVNGETVTVAMLKKISGGLIDIHGQHEHQSLLYPENHLLIVDRFDRDAIYPVKEKVAELYSEYVAVKKEYDTMCVSEEERSRELAFLEFERGEIEEAAVVAGEEEELEATYRKLKNSGNVLKAVSEAYGYTKEGSYNAGNLISDALGALNEVAGYDEAVDDYIRSLIDVDNILEDINHELSSYISRYSFDDELFEQTEKRLDFIRKLFAKYGGTYERMEEHYNEVIERYRLLSEYEKNSAILEEKLGSIKEELDAFSKKLTLLRRESAGKLCKLTRDALESLNFLNVNFDIEVNSDREYSANGTDRAEFLISTNPGEAVRPLADIASGGELSRIMLAIKSVLADKDSINTLVFDEIDAGISGRTAQMVSEKLAYISRNHQVICITHLAQIASMADAHYLIEKHQTEDGRTKTLISLLDEKKSEGELARILGGAKITDLVITSAAEMKKLAKQWKENL